MNFFNLPEDQPLSHSMVTRAIEQAQVKVEGRNFDIRKNTVEYDDVLNKQREIVYDLRRDILMLAESNGKAFRETVMKVLHEQIEAQINMIQFDSSVEVQEMNKTVLQELSLLLPIQTQKMLQMIEDQDQTGLRDYAMGLVKKEYDRKEKEVGPEIWRNVVRFIFLTVIDTHFSQHLRSIDDLREGIGLRGYSGIKPIVEYQNEAFSLFERLIRGMYFEAARRIFTVQVEAQATVQERKEQPLVLSSGGGGEQFRDTEQKPAKKRSSSVTKPTQKKIGRNDPCWCGSGKKYKKCHFPN